MSRTLEAAAVEAAVCTRCSLSKTRTQVVYGAGNPVARLMFVGEAPGANEDKRGLPFVGASGTLLTGLIEGIGLTRDDVYIANVLKCKPPGNRDPLPSEIDECKPWLKEQIEIIDPPVICTLGNFASKLLLGTSIGISRLRGRRVAWRGRTLIPTFHPAAVLHSGRNSDTMTAMETDFQLIAKVLAERGDPVADAPTDISADQLGLF